MHRNEARPFFMQGQKKIKQCMHFNAIFFWSSSHEVQPVAFPSFSQTQEKKKNIYLECQQIALCRSSHYFVWFMTSSSVRIRIYVDLSRSVINSLESILSWNLSSQRFLRSETSKKCLDGWVMGLHWKQLFCLKNEAIFKYF